MQVKELIEKLKKIDKDAFVVIGGDIISDIEIISGNVEIGYYNPIFIRSEHGHAKALCFLANGELSTGEVEYLIK